MARAASVKDSGTQNRSGVSCGPHDATGDGRNKPKSKRVARRVALFLYLFLGAPHPIGSYGIPEKPEDTKWGFFLWFFFRV